MPRRPYPPIPAPTGERRRPLWRAHPENGYRRGVTRVPPYVLVLVAIASVQFGASLAKGMFDSAHPITLAFLRGAFASVILLALARPRLRGRSRTDWAVASAYGVSLSGMNALIYLSFARIPVGMAVTLEFVGPLALSVWGSRRWLDLLWVGLAALGVLLLGLGPSGTDPLGIALALGAGVLWASYIVLAGPLGRRWEGGSGLAVGSVIGVAMLAVPGVALADGSITDPGVLGVIAVVALLSSVVPYGLELQARRTLPAATLGILMSLEPAAAALFAWIVLGEWLSTVEWIAMGAVIVASIGAIRTSRSRRPRGQETVGDPGAAGA